MKHFYVQVGDQMFGPFPEYAEATEFIRQNHALEADGVWDFQTSPQDRRKPVGERLRVSPMGFEEAPHK